jgi:hypothetical protein
MKSDFKFLSEKGIDLLVDKNLILEEVENVFGSLESIDGIVLEGDLAKHGERINGEIYKNDKFCKIYAALVRDDLSLKNMNDRRNVISYFPHPSPIFSDFSKKEFSRLQTIKPNLSFLWFFLTLIMTLMVGYLLITSYPKNRYYHIKNKRVIIEPSWF